MLIVSSPAVAVLALTALSTSAAPSLEILAAGPDSSCIVMDLSTDGRRSPLDSLTFLVDGHPVKVCYGRPSARGRTMIGGRDVPFGRLWRTGANEPTMIHASVPIRVAGIEIAKGTYSLYTIPRESEWTIILNSSITQWGHIARYNRKVKAQEVGEATVTPEPTGEHVETLTFRAEAGERTGAVLVLEWENTRIRIPVDVIGD